MFIAVYAFVNVLYTFNSILEPFSKNTTYSHTLKTLCSLQWTARCVKNMETIFIIEDLASYEHESLFVYTTSTITASRYFYISY